MESSKKGQREEEKQGDTILPQDLVEDILLRLPIKSLVRFRCVCKNWCVLIKSPRFISKQIQRTTENNPLLILNGCAFDGDDHGLYTLDYGSSNQATKLDFPFESFAKCFDRVDIVGSCNGLVCLGFSEGQYCWDTICLWNPATREQKFLPKIDSTSHYVSMGFGFDPIVNEYKVVRVVYFSDRFETNTAVLKSDVRVYTLGTDEWRRIEDISYHINERVSMAIVNGVVHWTASCSYLRRMSELVISFDSAQEVFKELPQPNYGDKNQKFIKHVGVLGGCLSVFCHFSDERIEIWMMKDYGLKESWTKQFVIGGPTISWFVYIQPLGLWTGGEILLEKDHRLLVLYDTKTNREREPGIQGLPQRFYSVNHIESLISLTVG
ncbi:F-box protein At3g07870-like isoform X2 [Telopea speciosissima]|nr:F-box protein At3g07870-like isoform X2 [Telopea speciosissima]